MNWMLLPFRRYATFAGRSPRREFWLFQLFNILVGFLLVVPATLLAATVRNSELRGGEGGFAASASFHTDYSGNPVSLALISLLGLYWLAIIVPSIAVSVRRFHDQGKSGWWYLALAVPSIIPLFGLIPATALLVFMLLPGTPGANRYGPDPKDPYNEELFA